MGGGGIGSRIGTLRPYVEVKRGAQVEAASERGGKRNRDALSRFDDIRFFPIIRGLLGIFLISLTILWIPSSSKLAA